MSGFARIREARRYLCRTVRREKRMPCHYGRHPSGFLTTSEARCIALSATYSEQDREWQTSSSLIAQTRSGRAEERSMFGLSEKSDGQEWASSVR